jgi:hypothetical protein
MLCACMTVYFGSTFDLITQPLATFPPRSNSVVVPTATMVATETCFDQTKLPFPATYAQQRRMAQRFDQSLIMEVQVVDVRSV